MSFHLQTGSVILELSDIGTAFPLVSASSQRDGELKCYTTFSLTDILAFFCPFYHLPNSTNRFWMLQSKGTSLSLFYFLIVLQGAETQGHKDGLLSVTKNVDKTTHFSNKVKACNHEQTLTWKGVLICNILQNVFIGPVDITNMTWHELQVWFISLPFCFR